MKRTSTRKSRSNTPDPNAIVEETLEMQPTRRSTRFKTRRKLSLSDTQSSVPSCGSSSSKQRGAAASPESQSVEDYQDQQPQQPPSLQQGGDNKDNDTEDVAKLPTRRRRRPLSRSDVTVADRHDHASNHTRRTRRRISSDDSPTTPAKIQSSDDDDDDDDENVDDGGETDTIQDNMPARPQHADPFTDDRSVHDGVEDSVTSNGESNKDVVVKSDAEVAEMDNNNNECIERTSPSEVTTVVGLSFEGEEADSEIHQADQDKQKPKETLRISDEVSVEMERAKESILGGVSQASQTGERTVQGMPLGEKWRGATKDVSQSQHHDSDQDMINNGVLLDGSQEDDMAAMKWAKDMTTSRTEIVTRIKEHSCDERAQLEGEGLNHTHVSSNEAISLLLDFSQSATTPISEASNNGDMVSTPEDCPSETMKMGDPDVGSGTTGATQESKPIDCGKNQSTFALSPSVGNVTADADETLGDRNEIQPVHTVSDNKERNHDHVEVAEVAQGSKQALSTITLRHETEPVEKNEHTIAFAQPTATSIGDIAVAFETIEGDPTNELLLVGPSARGLALEQGDPIKSNEVSPKGSASARKDVVFGDVSHRKFNDECKEKEVVDTFVEFHAPSNPILLKKHRSDRVVVVSEESMKMHEQPPAGVKADDMDIQEVQELVTASDGDNELEAPDKEPAEDYGTQVEREVEREDFLEANNSHKRLQDTTYEFMKGSTPIENVGGLSQVDADDAQTFNRVENQMHVENSDAVHRKGEVAKSVQNVASIQFSRSEDEARTECIVHNGATHDRAPQEAKFKDPEASVMETTAFPNLTHATNLNLKDSSVEQNDVKRGPTTRFGSRTLGVNSQEVSVEAIKVRIYTAGFFAHRGQGAERLFSSYWGALRRCFGTALNGDGSDAQARLLRGTREVIKKFITTKKLRRLHNSLLLGLLKRCAHDTTSSVDVIEHVPSIWRNRVHILAKEMIRPTMPVESETFESTIKFEFGEQSGLWTSVGVAGEFHTLPQNVKLSLNLQKNTQNDNISPPLPGAILVDPYVRSVAHREGLKVAENAVWLLVVGIREFVKSILKNTITTLDAVNEISELPRGSALIKQIGPVAKESDSVLDDEDVVIPSQKKHPGKRKCVSALDVATYMMSTPLSRGYGLNRSTFEKCYLSAFDPLSIKSQSDFDSVRNYIISGIDVSSPKRPRVRKDELFPPPGRTSNGNLPESNPRIEGPLAKSERVVPPQPTHARRSPSVRGMGRGAKNLAALKARAAAAASAAKNDAPSSVDASATPDQTNEDTKIVEEIIPISSLASSDAFKNPADQPSPIATPRFGFPNERSEEKRINDGPLVVSAHRPTVFMDQVDLSISYIPSQAQQQSSSVESKNLLTSRMREGEAPRLSDSLTTTVRDKSSISELPAQRGRGIGVKDLTVMKAKSAGSVGQRKDEGVNREEVKESHLTTTLYERASATGKDDVSDDFKSHGDLGSSTIDLVLKLTESSHSVSEPAITNDPNFQHGLDMLLANQGDLNRGHNLDTKDGTGRKDEIDVPLDKAPADAVAQFNEQGTPLAYTA